MVLGAPAAVGVLAAAAFVVWAQTPYRAEPGPLSRATATPGVEVTVGDDAVVIAPTGAAPRTGVVFYPGARVSPAAYAAAWAPIAARSGVRVVIPAMPLNLAVLAPNRAESTAAAFGGGVDRWYVGGHSLGGAMAASYAGGHPAIDVVGLVLWGSYATENAGLAESDLRVISVSGTRDGLSSPDDISENRPHLPPDAKMHEIRGMSHAQFGAYGTQPGDGTPQIGDAQARRELADTMTTFLDSEARR